MAGVVEVGVLLPACEAGWWSSKGQGDISRYSEAGLDTMECWADAVAEAPAPAPAPGTAIGGVGDGDFAVWPWPEDARCSWSGGVGDLTKPAEVTVMVPDPPCGAGHEGHTGHVVMHMPGQARYPGHVTAGYTFELGGGPGDLVGMNLLRILFSGSNGMYSSSG